MSSESAETWKPFWPPPSETPKPRGLLPVPPEVELAVAREKARLRPYFTDEAEKRVRDNFTLQYYYEGETILCRETPEGMEVLGVGMEEIGPLLDGMTQEELYNVIVRHP